MSFSNPFFDPYLGIDAIVTGYTSFSTTIQVPVRANDDDPGLPAIPIIRLLPQTVTVITAMTMPYDPLTTGRQALARYQNVDSSRPSDGGVIDGLYNVAPTPQGFIPYEAGTVQLFIPNGFQSATLILLNSFYPTHGGEYRLTLPTTQSYQLEVVLTGDLVEFGNGAVNAHAAPWSFTISIEIEDHRRNAPPLTTPPEGLHPTFKQALRNDAASLQKVTDGLDWLIRSLNPDAAIVKSLSYMAQEAVKLGAEKVGVDTAISQAMFALGDVAESTLIGLNPVTWVPTIAAAIDKLMIVVLKRLADDPASGHVDQVFAAPEWTFGDHPGASATGNKLVKDLFGLLGDYAEMLVSAERYQGAQLLGQDDAKQLQADAYNAAAARAVADRQAVIADLNAYVAELGATLTDGDLADGGVLADAKTYLAGLSDPASDPFLGKFLGGLQADHWLTGAQASALGQSIKQAVLGLTAPPGAGSAFAAIADGAAALTGVLVLHGPVAEYQVASFLDHAGALHTSVADGMPSRDGTHDVVGFTAAQFTDVTLDLPHAFVLNGVQHAMAGASGGVLAGNAGPNHLDGAGGLDVLFGFDGDDVLTGGGAPAGQYNQLWGGDGRDTASYANLSEPVYATIPGTGGFVDGGSGFVLTDSYDSIENLIGGSAGDILVGDAGSNAIAGGDGADTIDGGSGFDVTGGAGDTLDGGAGDDLIILSALTFGAAHGGDGNDTIQVFASYATGHGDADDDILTALGSNDELYGGAGNDLLTLLNSGSAYGEGDNDTLVGGIGNDSLDGGAGVNVLLGEGGDDRLVGATNLSGTPSQLFGGDGTDRADYSAVGGSLYVDLRGGGAFLNGVLADALDSVEDISGGFGANTLVGSGAGNRLRGGSGPDVLFGMDGDDVLIGDWGGDGSYNQLWGGSGQDTVSYEGTFSPVFASLEGHGGYVWDFDPNTFESQFVLTDSYDGVENLIGGSDGDTLVGDAVANRIQGGGGADMLYGRGGADTFVYVSRFDSSVPTGYDVIADFSSAEGDKIDLTSFGIDASRVLIATDAGTTSLYADTDPGTAGFELAIGFTGPGALTVADILF